MKLLQKSHSSKRPRRRLEDMIWYVGCLEIIQNECNGITTHKGNECRSGCQMTRIMGMGTVGPSIDNQTSKRAFY